MATQNPLPLSVPAQYLSVSDGGTKLTITIPPGAKGSFSSIAVTSNGATQTIKQGTVILGPAPALTGAGLAVNGSALPAGASTVGVNAKTLDVTLVKGDKTKGETWWTDDTSLVATPQGEAPVTIGRPLAGQSTWTATIQGDQLSAEGPLVLELVSDYPADPPTTELVVDRLPPSILSFHDHQTGKELAIIAWGQSVDIKVRGNLPPSAGTTPGTTWTAKSNLPTEGTYQFTFQDAETTVLVATAPSTLPTQPPAGVIGVTMTNPANGAKGSTDLGAEVEIAIAGTPQEALVVPVTARRSGTQPAMHPLEVAIVSTLSGEAGTSEVLDQIRQVLESADWPEQAIAASLPKLKKCRSIQHKKDLHAAVRDILHAAYTDHGAHPRDRKSS
jgi:hypothetical protein